MNKEELIDITIKTGLAAGFLYFSGYLHLLNYFSNLGNHLIPISDIPVAEVMLFGIFPTVIFMFIIFIGKNLKNKFSLIKENLNKKLTIVLGITLFFVCIKIYSSIIFALNLPYNFLIISNTKTPIVEVIYNSPLVGTEQTIINKDFYYKEFTITEFKVGKLYSKGFERFFVDAFGAKHFIGNFILYFESKDNYYISPVDEMFKPDLGEIIVKGFADDEKKETEIVTSIKIGGKYDIDPFKLIIVPKSKIESIKYHNLNFDKYYNQDLNQRK